MLAGGVSLPIVYITGHVDVPMSIHAMKNGALDILLKPADEAAIMDAMIPFVSHAPRPQIAFSSSREGKNGGTVSIWVERTIVGSPN